MLCSYVACTHHERCATRLLGVPLPDLPPDRQVSWSQKRRHDKFTQHSPAGSRRIAQTNRTTIHRHTACQYVAMAEVQRARLVALARALAKNTHRDVQNGFGLATSSAVILKGRFRTKRIRFTCRAQPPREHGDQRAHARLHTPTNLGGQTGVCTSAECAVHAYQAKSGSLLVLPPESP